MTASETAYLQVTTLVRKFKTLSTHERKAMNESSTRQGYILPLFAALQWNTTDVNEVSPVYTALSPAIHFDEIRTLERRISQVDGEIDRRVYELYGLTEEEIRIVEGE